MYSKYRKNYGGRYTKNKFAIQKYSKKRRRFMGSPTIKFPSYTADLPTKKYAKLKYCMVSSLGAAIAAPGVHEFRANGMYDPDVTYVGHQPYGFDQLMAKYNHYVVLKSKIKICIVATTEIDSVYGIALTDTTGQVAATYAGGGGYDAVMELPFRSRTLLHSKTGATEKDREATLYFDAAKFFGKSQQAILGERDYRGTVSSDPAELAIFTVFCLSPSSIAVNARAFHIELEFSAVFTEPKVFATS